jgi:hypothetical protein
MFEKYQSIESQLVDIDDIRSLQQISDLIKKQVTKFFNKELSSMRSKIISLENKINSLEKHIEQLIINLKATHYEPHKDQLKNNLCKQIQTLEESLLTYNHIVFSANEKYNMILDDFKLMKKKIKLQQQLQQQLQDILDLLDLWYTRFLSSIKNFIENKFKKYHEYNDKL